VQDDFEEMRRVTNFSFHAKRLKTGHEKKGRRANRGSGCPNEKMTCPAPKRGAENLDIKKKKKKKYKLKSQKGGVYRNSGAYEAL